MLSLIESDSASAIHVVTIDRSNVRTLYLGTFDGVFKTTNGGANWTTINTGLNAASVNSVAIDPKFPNNLYVTGARGRLFKSIDGAENWNATGLVDVQRVTIDPVTSTMIYAALGQSVLKSTDGGANWSTTGKLNSGPPAAIAIDPVIPTILYVGTGGGVYKSADGGETWRLSGLTGLFVQSIAIDPVTPTNVYAGTGGTDVFKSTDRGESWNRIAILDGAVLSLVIDPMTPTTLYAVTAGGGIAFGRVLKSTDGGVTWRRINAGLTMTDVRAVAIDPMTPTTLYVGTDSGVFKSINGGDDWTAISTGLTATDVRALAIDPSTPAVVYAGTNGGVFKTTSLAWTFCANENQFCSFSGTKLVRYGAGTSFNFLTATNGINCNNTTFGDPIVGTVKHCEYGDASPPPTWSFCGNENQFCSFTGTKLVRYGAGTRFNFLTATNGINCNNATFGDPIVGTVKHCDYSDISPSSWTFCANENQSCLFNGTKLVRYGAGTSFSLLTATNGVSCNNATFGDPILGIVKHCEYKDI